MRACGSEGGSAASPSGNTGCHLAPQALRRDIASASAYLGACASLGVPHSRGWDGGRRRPPQVAGCGWLPRWSERTPLSPNTAHGLEDTAYEWTARACNAYYRLADDACGLTRTD